MGDFKSLFFSTLLLSSGLALSGCVSGDIASDIAPVTSNGVPIPQSRVLNEQGDLASLPQEGANVLPTNGIPIPSSAPRPVLAMAPESQTLDQPAVEQVNNLASGTQIAETPSAQATQPAIEVAAVEAPKRKLTFFELLRQKAEERKASELAAKQAQTARLENARLQAASRKQASAAALPGVKQGDKLFGIGKAEGDAEVEENTKVASIGGFARSMVKNGLVLQTSSVQVGCFKPELMKVLKIVERRYGRKVMVTSGYRSPARNRRAGGVRNSSHVYCKAADIQVVGVSKWDLAKFLRTIPGRGGVGTYCRTKSVHIDVGSQRDWHHACRRTKSKKRKT